MEKLLRAIAVGKDILSMLPFLYGRPRKNVSTKRPRQDSRHGYGQAFALCAWAFLCTGLLCAARSEGPVLAGVLAAPCAASGPPLPFALRAMWFDVQQSPRLRAKWRRSATGRRHSADLDEHWCERRTITLRFVADWAEVGPPRCRSQIRIRRSKSCL